MRIRVNKTFTFDLSDAVLIVKSSVLETWNILTDFGFASAMAGINWTVNQIIARIIMHWCTREMRDTLANERCGWEVRMSRENGIHNRILSWALQAGGYADQLMAYRNSQRKRLNRQYNMGDTSKWVKQHLCWLFFFSARLNIQTSTLCKPLTAKYSRQWKICC